MRRYNLGAGEGAQPERIEVPHDEGAVERGVRAGDGEWCEGAQPEVCLGSHEGISPADSTGLALGEVKHVLALFDVEFKPRRDEGGGQSGGLEGSVFGDEHGAAGVEATRMFDVSGALAHG